jgi:tRNA(fMet)-specific endonuclease VapC
MSGRYLLDTNIVIALFAGDPAVSEPISFVGYAALPVVALGELAAGAMYSTRVNENLKRLLAFSDTVPLLHCNRETAFAYAELSVSLRRKGKPIPENDLWIAALAKQHDLTLVSRDMHFEAVDGITWERWESKPH